MSDSPVRQSLKRQSLNLVKESQDEDEEGEFTYGDENAIDDLKLQEHLGRNSEKVTIVDQFALRFLKFSVSRLTFRLCSHSQKVFSIGPLAPSRYRHQMLLVGIH